MQFWKPQPKCSNRWSTNQGLTCISSIKIQHWTLSKRGKNDKGPFSSNRNDFRVKLYHKGILQLLMVRQELIMRIIYHWVAGAVSCCLSTAHPVSRTVPPILFGGQYLNTDLPSIFFAGNGPLKSYLQKKNQLELCYKGWEIEVFQNHEPKVINFWKQEVRMYYQTCES